MFEAISFNFCLKYAETLLLSLGGWSNQNPLSLATSCFLLLFALRISSAYFSYVLRSFIKRVGRISFDELMLILRTCSLKFPATSTLTKAKQQRLYDVNKIMQSL